MKRYLLDTSALLTLRDDEMGANQFAEILHQARQHQSKPTIKSPWPMPGLGRQPYDKMLNWFIKIQNSKRWIAINCGYPTRADNKNNFVPQAENKMTNTDGCVKHRSREAAPIIPTTIADWLFVGAAFSRVDPIHQSVGRALPDKGLHQ